MLDIYKKEGSFPSVLVRDGHYFKGPIRSHTRPRRLWSVIIMLISSYLTLPPVVNVLYALFCSGCVYVLIAMSIVLSGIKLIYLISLNFLISFLF